MDIELKEVSKKYQKKTILQDVNLAIPSGQVVGVQGVSGSGKTTLLRLLAGLELLDAGQILLNGNVVSKLNWQIPPHERQIGFAFQIPALWPHLCVWENISYGLHHLTKAEKISVVEDLAKKFEIEPLLYQYPGKLSGGEAQRVALARTLAAPFKRLLIDEPFAHLDKDVALKILPVILERCQQQNSTLIWVSHNAAVVEPFVDMWVKVKDCRVEVL